MAPNNENYIDDNARKRIHEILDKVIDVRNEVGGYVEFGLDTIIDDLHIAAKPGILGDHTEYRIYEYSAVEELGEYRKKRIIKNLEHYRLEMIEAGKARGEVK